MSNSLGDVNEDEENSQLYIMVGPADSTRPRPDALVAGPVIDAPSPGPSAELSPPAAQAQPPDPPCEMVRRSARETAGRHSNPHHLPVKIGGRIMNSLVHGVSNSTSVMFRPWSWASALSGRQ